MARKLTTGFELGEVIEHNGTLVGTGANSVQTGMKRTGAYAWRIQVGSVAFGNYKAMTHTLPGNPQELYVRAAVYLGTSAGASTNAQMLMAFCDQATVHLSIGIPPTDNRIRIYRGGTGELGHTPGTYTELAAGSIVLNELTWYVLEVYVKVSNTVGQVIVKVNGVTDATFGPGDTASSANEYTDVFKVGANGATVGAGRDYYLDDIALNDTTGGESDSWVGLGGVYFLVPTADGSSSDWTPLGGGNHWEEVDEIPADDDTSYVYDDTAGAKDLYELANLPALVNSINLVETVFQAALSEAGSNDIRGVIRHSGVDYSDTPTHTITNVHPNYALLKGDPVYQVLGGAGAWTPAQVNALEAGFEIV